MFVTIDEATDASKRTAAFARSDRMSESSLATPSNLTVP